LQLFAPASLNLWPSTDVATYTGVLRLLIAFASGKENLPKTASIPVEDGSPCRAVLHQICDLPETWIHLRRPLIIFALKQLVFSFSGLFSLPLHSAIRMDDFKVFKYLLETSDTGFLDAHLRNKDDYGKTPLARSIEQVIAQPDLSLDITRALLERGASLDDTVRARSRRL